MRAAALVLAVLSMAGCAPDDAASRVDPAPVLELAQAYNGQAVTDDWAGTGRPTELFFNNRRIFTAGDGWHCVGFSFEVADQLARKRGLYDGWDHGRYIRYTQAWAGAEGRGLRSLVAAMEEYGTGWAVGARDAKPGDFLVLHRVNGSSHQAIFCDWEYAGYVCVGVKFLGAHQGRGVSEKIETFAGSGVGSETILYDQLSIGRLRDEPTAD